MSSPFQLIDMTARAATISAMHPTGTGSLHLLLAWPSQSMASGITYLLARAASQRTLKTGQSTGDLVAHSWPAPVMMDRDSVAARRPSRSGSRSGGCGSSWLSPSGSAPSKQSCLETWTSRRTRGACGVGSGTVGSANGHCG